MPTLSLARPLQLSPHLVGEPVTGGPDIAAFADLAALPAAEVPAGAGLLPLAPGAALVHALTTDRPAAELRWVRLPHAPRLAPLGEPVTVAAVLTFPLADSGRALRLIGRLSACLCAPGVLVAAAAAESREALVHALAAGEAEAGEMPLAPGEVLALLGSSAAGLTAAERARRLAAAGPNRIERVRRRPLLGRLAEQFWSFFAVLLWVAAGCAFLAGLPQFAWAILGVIGVNGVFSFLQEYRAERAVEALERMLPREITVRVDGRGVRVPAAEVVPGDVVRLAEGDQVPADAQVLEAALLRVDQSALTGESHPVFKLPATGNQRARVPLAERQELVFAGTAVVAGDCAVVVRATGMRTEIGAIAELTQAVREELSPLGRELRRLTRIVTVLAVAFGMGFFALGVTTGTMAVAEGLVFALGVIVANVPEGLLPTLTLALAMGVQRMARQGCLVKRLSAVEALGATTVICTDKTGTLTQNRMAARSVWLGGREVAAEALDARVPADVVELLEAGALASQATADRGDPTEVALVRGAVAVGVDPQTARAGRPVAVPYPFDSFRKRMTLVRVAGAATRAYVKGAPVETLALCARIRWGDDVVPLGERERRAVLDAHERLAAEGLRLLAVAVRDIPSGLVDGPASAVERELTFLGLVALWDPPRPEVAEAVDLCRRAGIRVIMITGDYGLTAQAIARRIGLTVTRVVTGDEVARLRPAALRALAREPGVCFARTSPAHKLAIVEALRESGEVVTVTGDGVNDAPALRAAQSGVAMGRRGSEVAREAAVMVITDDNFASIVTAVRQGRGIYANMGKFVTYILASNVPELAPFLLSVFAGVPLPLTVMQILAVDLGTDLVPALALGAEPPEPDVMDRPPRPREAALMGTGRLVHAYGFLGVIEAVLSLGAFFWTYWVAGWRPGLPMAAEGELYRRATTMTLAGIVAAQVGNVFACRTDRESVFRAGLAANRLVFAGVAAELGLLAALIGIAPLRDAFGLAVPSLADAAVLPLLPAVVLLLEEARKWVVRRRGATDLVTRGLAGGGGLLGSAQ